MKRILITTGFALMVALQWFIPGRMIFYKERVLSAGKEFRFRTEPFDPYDAFRGKYVHLAFNQTMVQLKDTANWYQGETIFALLSEDSSGYAMVTELRKEEPGEDVDYLKVVSGYIYQDSTVTSVSISYPFDRFYMEESKAQAADDAYHQALSDTSKVTYALVLVHHGEGVVKDVFIDGVPIKQVAIERQKQEEQVQ
jgi:uncharacterized membrane-anchored protein